MSAIPSNPFSTRFVAPGAIPFRFHANANPLGAHSAETIVDQLTRVRFGVIVGPHGSGKSTLLKSMEPLARSRFKQLSQIQTHACESSGWRASSRHRATVWRSVRHKLNQLGDGGLLIVDGLEQLSRFDRWRLVARAKARGLSILATSHSESVHFATLYRTEITRELVQSLAEELLEDAPPKIRQAVAEELDARDLASINDVRQLWFDLYDSVQSELIAANDSSSKALRV